MTELDIQNSIYDKEEAFLIAYIPFRALRVKSNSKSHLVKDPLNTKLLIKSLKDKIEKQRLQYTIYDYESTLNNENKLDDKEEKYCESIQNELNSINIRVNEFNNKATDNIKKQNIKNFLGTNILNISLSFYNDSHIKKYKKIGFLKVLIGMKFTEESSEEDKISSIRCVYDVISRAVKEKHDEETAYLDFGFSYKKLNETIKKLSFEGNDYKKYSLEIEEDDWAFNNPGNDRRCYTFAYIIEKKDINEYKNNKLSEDLYHLSRIHETGKIRTYSKDNNVVEIYHDDTSAIWSISKVGIGSICVQTKTREILRNISVLNNDFSLLYEICLHQKFFYYLLIQYDEIMDKKSIFKKRIINDYLEKKEEMNYFIDTFCPEIASEFETQDIYEIIREKLGINKLMIDANNSLKALDASVSKRRNFRYNFISSIAFIFGIPVVLYQYIKAVTEIEQPAFTFQKFIFLTLIGVILCFINALAGRVGKK